jgi:hypothetical protein
VEDVERGTVFPVRCLDDQPADRSHHGVHRDPHHEAHHLRNPVARRRNPSPRHIGRLTAGLPMAMPHGRGLHSGDATCGDRTSRATVAGAPTVCRLRRPSGQQCGWRPTSHRGRHWFDPSIPTEYLQVSGHTGILARSSAPGSVQQRRPACHHRSGRDALNCPHRDGLGSNGRRNPEGFVV